MAAHELSSTLLDEKGRLKSLSLTPNGRSVSMASSPPRSPPLHLDVTAERCGFLDTLALDKSIVRPRHRAPGAVIILKADEARTGHLAMAILVAPADVRECDLE